MSKKEGIKQYVTGKIKWLQAISETTNGKSYLAELRKGVGKEPGELPNLFGVFLEGMPEEFISNNGKPTREEWACYVALTLFAWHQQGYDLKNNLMHTDEKVSVGTAAKRLKQLSADSNAEERTIRKMQQIITANDIKGFSQYLRSMIKLFAGNKIRLNYALLAADIYEWQIQEYRNNVNLRWGQDYYKQIKEDKENE